MQHRYRIASIALTTAATLTLASCALTPDPGRPGDADCDGLITERDAQLVEDYVLDRIDAADVPCFHLADPTGNGHVTMTDVAWIRAHLED